VSCFLEAVVEVVKVIVFSALLELVKVIAEVVVLSLPVVGSTFGRWETRTQRRSFQSKR
jgi:hypothetical protein